MNETCENKKFDLHYYITYLNKIKPLYTNTFKGNTFYGRNYIILKLNALEQTIDTHIPT
jgi:hypothetical protein